jgi:hypothetical protein
LGVETQVKTAVSDSSGSDGAIIAISGTEKLRTLSVAKLVQKTLTDDTELTRAAAALPPDVPLDTVRANLEHHAIPFRQDDVRGVALLAVQEQGGQHVTIEFSVVHDFSDKEPVVLGKTSFEDIKKLRGRFKHLEGRFLGGTLSNMDLEYEVDSFGLLLADKVLQGDASKKLEGFYGRQDITTVLVFSNTVDIPWEWIKPSTDAMRLGRRWNAVRWRLGGPGDHIRAFSGAARLSEFPQQPFFTLGLNPDENKRWRLELPKAATDKGILDLFPKAKTWHWIAHFAHSENEEGDNVPTLVFGSKEDEKSVAFSLEAIRTRKPKGPHYLIISACKAAAVSEEFNFADAFACYSDSNVWAPLIALTLNQAEKIDALIWDRVSKNPNMTIADLMREAQDEEPLLALYVQHGLRRYSG